MVAFNFIFIVLFPSALCFLMWNKATLLIGAIKTNIYVYLTPIITIIVAMIAIDEQLGFYEIIGVILTRCGVIIGEYRNKNS
ncbi:EamA family transporter [Helicobacter cinaedi]|uniref:EamA family transporter n=1 Tax=Helicobacter cinaedi TaxID=213 RepID=UPI001FB4BB6E|nr:EamA family transporter [Helicobacter cinaedi]